MSSAAVQRIVQAAMELLSPSQLEKLKIVQAEAEAALGRLHAVDVTTNEIAHQVQAGLVEVKRLLKIVVEERGTQLEPLLREEKAIRMLWSLIEDPLKELDRTASRKVLAWMQAEDARLARKAAEARRKQEEAAERQRQAEEAAAAATQPEARAEAERAVERAEVDLAMARVAEPATARVQAIKGAGGGSSYRRPAGWTYKVVNGTRPDWLAVALAVLEEVRRDTGPGVGLSPAHEALRLALAQEEAAVPARYWSIDDKAVKAAIAGGAHVIPGLAIWQEETLATRT